MGNGLGIRCLNDSWILGLDPLVNATFASANLDIECHLKEMVMDDGTWNLDLFRVWLPEEVILRIVGIPPLILMMV